MGMYGHHGATYLCGGVPGTTTFGTSYKIAKELSLSTKVEDKSLFVPTSHNSDVRLELALYNVPASG